MAKKSMIERESKRTRLVAKHAEKRLSLKKIIRNINSTDAEREAAQMKLNAMPRDSSSSRMRNRCVITGRPHGVYRKLKISRIALRELTLEGKIPGMVKSSW